VKNKTAAPFREAEFDIMYGEGISREGDLIDLGVNKNLVEKSGAWFSYKNERIGQGRENAKQFLKENKDVATKLETELRKELGLKSLAPEPPAPTPEQKQAAAVAHGKLPAARR
jgi:recombination protein RecA